MSTGAVAATEHPLASMAACRALQNGGNAFDGAAAASFVLAVTQPQLSGLGGDFFGLLYVARTGEVMCLNSSGWAPSSASVEGLRNAGHGSIPRSGPLSVVIPGHLRGVYEMQRRFGELEFARALDDATRLAEDGFPAGPELVRTLASVRAEISPEAVRTFESDGKALKVGSLLRQKRLAETLRGISRDGPDWFYGGPPARAIRKALAAGGFSAEEDDLSSFQAEWCDPLVLEHHGTQVFEVPPNSMGATTLLILKLLQEADSGASGPSSLARIETTIRAAKEAYAVRDREIGDPRFVPFDLDRFLGTTRNAIVPRRFDEADTTYFAVADEKGNLLSCIQSVYSHWGSKVFVDECGFFLNNRGAAFALDGPNRLEPRKRPIHTLSSLMLLRDGKPAFAAGCSGGELRPQQHALLVTNLVDYSMDLEQAINYPRFLWDGAETVKIEEGFDGMDELSLKHHLLAYPGRTGVAHGIEVMSECFKGVCDVRSEGLPAGN